MIPVYITARPPHKTSGADLKALRDIIRRFDPDAGLTRAYRALSEPLPFLLGHAPDEAAARAVSAALDDLGYASRLNPPPEPETELRMDGDVPAQPEPEDVARVALVLLSSANGNPLGAIALASHLANAAAEPENGLHTQAGALIGSAFDGEAQADRIGMMGLTADE